MLFLVGEKNADYAYESLQNEIRKKETEGFDLDAMPSEDTRNICKEMEQANLIGDPTEFQVFNARFQQSSFSKPQLVDKIGNQIRASKLCRNLQARIRAVSGTRGGSGKQEAQNGIEEKQEKSSPKPSNSFERSFMINFDKDVTAPLKLQKSNFNDYLYSQQYERIVSKWSLGYVHGFMAFAKYQDMDVNYELALGEIQNFTDGILKAVFSEKEYDDFKLIDRTDLSSSTSWRDGFDWGKLNCESWQQNGEVTKIWLDYISGTRDYVFRLD